MYLVTMAILLGDEVGEMPTAELWADTTRMGIHHNKPEVKRVVYKVTHINPEAENPHLPQELKKTLKELKP